MFSLFHCCFLTHFIILQVQLDDLSCKFSKMAECPFGVQKRNQAQGILWEDICLNYSFTWCCNLRLRLGSAGHACVLYGRSCSLVILCYLTPHHWFHSVLGLSLGWSLLLFFRCMVVTAIMSRCQRKSGCVLLKVRYCYDSFHFTHASSISDLPPFWGFTFATVLDQCCTYQLVALLDGVHLLEYYRQPLQFHLWTRFLTFELLTVAGD